MATSGESFPEAFEDADVVRCYRHRAPYPEALHARLIGLAAGGERLLDLGCGPGKLARALAQSFAAVDAVDPSAAMLAEAKALDAGAHPNIRWIEAKAEAAPLRGPYDLAVAGAAIHWMDHAALMPKLVQALRPGARLALVDGDGPAEAPWRAAYQAVIVRWVEKGGRRWQDAAHTALVTAHLPWFDAEGSETFATDVRQAVEDLIAAEHSRATWARSRMGADAAAFDLDLRRALEPFAEDGEVVYRTRTTLTWGRPRAEPA